MSNPYRSRGYSAQLHANDDGDFLQIYRSGELACEVAVSVFPDDGPKAQPSIRITRFRPDEFQRVRETNAFDERAEG